ncbi:MAG: hypothetical protein V3U84_00690 [Thiotrichaceae bacterium]
MKIEELYPTEETLVDEVKLNVSIHSLISQHKIPSIAIGGIMEASAKFAVDNAVKKIAQEMAKIDKENTPLTLYYNAMHNLMETLKS